MMLSKLLSSPCCLVVMQTWNRLQKSPPASTPIFTFSFLLLALVLWCRILQTHHSTAAAWCRLPSCSRRAVPTLYAETTSCILTAGIKLSEWHACFMEGGEIKEARGSTGQYRTVVEPTGSWLYTEGYECKRSDAAKSSAHWILWDRL